MISVLHFFLIWEFLLALKRKHTRRIVFERARARSISTGKKLLVIGDPSNGFFNKITGSDYGYGDECIDLTGCPDADKEHVVIHKGSVEDILPLLDLSKYIIFQSCVFEYIDRYEVVKRTLENVSTEDLFFVNVEPWSFAAYIYPGFMLGDYSVPKRVFLSYPPFEKFTYAFDNPFARYNRLFISLVMLKVLIEVYGLYKRITTVI